jgi:hypothetical protein
MILLILSILIQIQCFPQNSIKDLHLWKTDIPEILKQITQQKLSIDQISSKDFISFRDTLYFAPDGTQYLFFWKKPQNELIRIDSCRFHGYNFQRYLFIYDNKIYSLGGYGFWQPHSILTAFDFRTHEWELQIVSGSIPFGKIEHPFQIGNEIFCLGLVNAGYYYKDANSFFDKHIYKLDLQTFRWERVKNLKFDVPYTGDPIEDSNWYVTRSIIVNKRTKEIEIPKLQYPYIENITLGYVSFIVKDTFFSTIQSDPQKKPIPIRISLNDILKEPNLQKYSLEPSIITKISKYYSWVLASLIILGLLLIVNWYRVKTKNDAIAIREMFEGSEILEFKKIISEYDKNVLSTDELDKVLKIDHLQPNSKKIKRSLIIKKFEEYFSGFITRERSTDDKRIFNYRINKK